MVLVRRKEGLDAMYTRVGSLADMLLRCVSLYQPCAVHQGKRQTHLLNFGASTLRTEADLEPDGGECAVLLEEPPSSLLLRGADERLIVTSSICPPDPDLP